MVGRPRRRHVVNRDGRLRNRGINTTHQASRPLVDERKLSLGLVSMPKRLKLFLASLFGVALVIIVWAAIGGILTYSKVVDTSGKRPALSFLGGLKPNQLQGEGDGRINVLLIGVGGAKHPGGTLADTIMVASFDTKNKEVALLSIPRDLYVSYDNKRSSKINAVHAYGEQNAKNTGGGPALLKKTVGTILDLPVHYYVRVDFTALQKIVDTLGGVTVDVERTIVDNMYPADNMIDYAPFRLAAGTQKLDGKTALKFVRSRHGANGEGTDFARADRQQKVLAAIKEKAMTVGVLTNPKKISELIGILGDHVKTDISLVEAERFFSLWKDVDSSKIMSKVIDNSADGPLVSHSGDERGAILLTRTGDYTEVQQIAHELFIDPYLREEKATIALVNASGSTATGTYVAKLLKDRGYQVTDITPKTQEKQTKTSILDHTKTKPYTRQFLETRFKAIASYKGIERVNAADTTTKVYDMTLAVGADYQPPRAKAPVQTKATAKPTPSLSPQPNEGSDAATQN